MRRTATVAAATVATVLLLLLMLLLLAIVQPAIRPIRFGRQRLLLLLLRLRVIVRRIAAWLQPFVPRSLVGRHPPSRIPLQTACHKVGECDIGAAQRLRQRTRAGFAFAAFGVGDAARTAARVEEETPPGGGGDELLGRHAADLHDAGELLDFVLAGEEWVAGVEFGEDAAWKLFEINL